jgi:hypothetical protein
MSEYVPTTLSHNRETIRRFLTGEGGVVCNQGRLTTYQADEDTVLLLSYTNEVLASVTDNATQVELYTGHYGQVSKTTSSHLATLGSVLSYTDGKNVTATDEAPTMGVGSRASKAAQYIGDYVGSFSRARSFSPVELDARETVEQALQERLQQLF